MYVTLFLTDIFLYFGSGATLVWMAEVSSYAISAHVQYV
jgi:hypothetical protein